MILLFGINRKKNQTIESLTKGKFSFDSEVFIHEVWVCELRVALPGGVANAKRCKKGPVTSGESLILDKLLDLVGRGDAHVQTVAEIARAVRDESLHSVHQKLEQLAACGTHGKCESNTERDFQRLLRGSNGLHLDPYNITLSLQAPSQRNKESF